MNGSVTGGTQRLGGGRLRFRLPRVGREAGWVWAAVLAFIGTSVWWLSRDSRMPDYDSGAHMAFAATAHAEMAAGQFSKLFTDLPIYYPPLVHDIGALTMFISDGALHPMLMILSSNVIFVPLLAFGCYGIGRRLYGPGAGLLAALFALGSPMFAGMMHEYDLDPPQAAMIAAAICATVMSGRFERPGWSAAAGLASACALLIKETSIIFLAGFLVVALVRTRPRHWRGLLSYAAVLGILAGPWYVYHWTAIFQGANQIGGLAPNAFQSPPRYSRANYLWYFWNLMNEQIMAPFLLAFVIGVVVSIRRVLVSRFSRSRFDLELLAGCAVSYAGMTYLTHKDPRYTLPMLVYVAVLATGWISALKARTLRLGVSALICGLAALYFLGVSVGVGGNLFIKLPGAGNDIIFTRQLALQNVNGWTRGAPVHDADVLSLFEGLHSEGYDAVEQYAGADPIDFNTWGLLVTGVAAGLDVGVAGPPDRQAIVTLLAPLSEPGTAPPPHGVPRPCQTMVDGSRIYVIRGVGPGLDPNLLRDDSDLRRTYQFICPGRAPVTAP